MWDRDLTRRGVLVGGASALFASSAPAWPLPTERRGLQIIVATGVVLAAESTLRRSFPIGDPRFVSLDLLGPRFADGEGAGVSGLARDQAKQDWSLQIFSLCQVDEKPRAAHLALARLQAALVSRGGSLTVVADAIDGLHERAGLRDVVHGFGLRCHGCGLIIDHRCDRSLYRGADCPQCVAQEALWRFEPFWTGGRMSRGDGVSDTFRLREAVAAVDLVVTIGDGTHDRARHGMTWAAKHVGTPVLIISSAVASRRGATEPGEGRIEGAVDVVVPDWAGELAEQHGLASEPCYDGD